MRTSNGLESPGRAVAAAALLALAAGCDSLENPGHIVNGVAYKPDGTAALFFYDGLGTVDDQLKIANWTGFPELPKAGSTSSARLSADGTRAVVAWRSGSTTAADGKTVQPPQDPGHLVVLDAGDGRQLRALDGAFGAVALSEHGDIVIATSVPPGDTRNGPALEVAAYSVADGSKLWSVPGNYWMVAAIPGKNAVAAVSDGDTRGMPGTLHLMDLTSGTGTLQFALPASDFVEALAVSPDGAVAAVASVRETTGTGAHSHYFVVSTADASLVREVVSPPNRLAFPDLAIAAGGRYLASFAALSGDAWQTEQHTHELLIWEEGTLRHNRPVELWVHTAPGLAFAPDGNRLAGTEGNGFRLYAVPDGTLLGTQQYRQKIF